MTYIVQTAAAKMPNTCWGVYRRIAILEVKAGVKKVAMISTRARGLVRIVRTWEKLNVGTTNRCAFERALSEARALCDRLNEAKQT